MLLYLIIIIIGIVLDQLSKQFVIASISGVTTMPIIPNILHFTYVENTGAAFSIFSDMKIFLIALSLLFTVGLSYLLFTLPKTKKFMLANIAISLIISGAIGNIIDRIRLSYVVDFIDFRFIHFAVFNLADVLVVVGTFMLIFAIFRNNQPATKKQPKTRTRVNKPQPEPVKTTDPEIIPDVKTDIKRLPDHSYETVKFEPTLLTPLQEEVITSTTQPVYESESVPEFIEYEPPKVERPKNRYNLSADSYEQSVREQSTGTIKRPNRYAESLSRYEESVKHSEPAHPPKRKEPSEWNPQIEHRERKQEPPSVWNPGQTFTPKTANPGRYTEMLDSYERSIRKTEVKVKEVKEGPVWEPVGNKKREPVQEKEEPKFVPEEIPKEPRKKNRYNQKTDDYLKSIDEAKKKHYTDN